MFVCLQSLDTKVTLHPLSTTQNNEPVPQVIETGCKLDAYFKIINYFIFRNGCKPEQWSPNNEYKPDNLPAQPVKSRRSGFETNLEGKISGPNL